MSRLRWRTFTMSTATRSVVVPNSALWRATYATFALQISFLLGMQLMFGHEPPIHRRSTTAVRRPDRARSQASSFPPCPLPSTSASYRSGAAIRSLQAEGASDVSLLMDVSALRFRRSLRNRSADTSIRRLTSEAPRSEEHTSELQSPDQLV